MQISKPKFGHSHKLAALVPRVETWSNEAGYSLHSIVQPERENWGSRRNPVFRGLQLSPESCTAMLTSEKTTRHLSSWVSWGPGMHRAGAPSSRNRSLEASCNRSLEATYSRGDDPPRRAAGISQEP